MEIYDRIYDYISRDRKILFVIAAGNLDQINNGNVTSPGKAYNVLTVGGFNTNETSSWNDDSMWDGSCYIDPYIDNQSTSGDRNKPEVVAVGKSVEVPNIIGGGYSLADGTSVAAPQVSGLATLLIQQNWMLAFEPSALKSIIMASAIHNIEGDPKLSDHDGTGAIVVSSAFDITNPFRGAYDYEVWDDITSLFSQSNNYIDLTSENMISGVLFARKGERVRTVISWESNPSSNYSTDPLSSDLDLYAYAPSGSFVQASISNNNNYEILDFTAPETGEYKLKLHYIFRSTEGVNLGFGLAWWRSPDVFLPVIINNP
jgi:hypothetical protein